MMWRKDDQILGASPRWLSSTRHKGPAGLASAMVNSQDPGRARALPRECAVVCGARSISQIADPCNWLRRSRAAFSAS
jgi:hypothetical protein